MHQKLLLSQFGIIMASLVPFVAQAEVIVSEQFDTGPGCLTNFDADVFGVADGTLTVGTNGIRTGCNNPPGGREYRHALCDTDIPGDFTLDVDVLIENRQEFRAGVVYGWTDPNVYYIFHFNDFENGVLQLIRFDGVTCFNMLASPQFDSLRDHWYHVRIEVTGDRHQVFVDGTLQIDVTDTNYVGGLTGLSASFNGYGLFDNLLVTGSSAHPDPELSILRSPSLPDSVAVGQGISGDFDWNVYSGDTQPGNPVWINVYGWRRLDGTWAGPEPILSGIWRDGG